MKNLILLALFILLSCDGIEGQALNPEDTQALISEISEIDKCIDPCELKGASFDKEKLLGTWELENIIDLKNKCKKLPKHEKHPEQDNTYLNFVSHNKILARTSNELSGDYSTDTGGKITVTKFGGTKMGEIGLLQREFSGNFRFSTHFFIKDGKLNILTRDNYKLDDYKLIFKKVKDKALNPEDTQALISEISKIDKCIDPCELKGASFDKEKLLGIWKLQNIIYLNDKCKKLSRHEKYPERDNTYLNFVSYSKLTGQTTDKISGDYMIIGIGKISVINFWGPGIDQLRLQAEFTHIFPSSKYFFINGESLNILTRYYKLIFKRHEKK